MFEPSTRPRLFGLPPGADFGCSVIEGLRARIPVPGELRHVQLFVNTRRMQRRLEQLFDHGPATTLPRLHVITDLARDPLLTGGTEPVPALRRRLELTALISDLIAQQPDLAPRSSLFALADSLAAIFDEMHGEGVSAEVLANLDVTDQSGHWQRALQFLRIAEQFDRASHSAPDAEQQQRRAVCALIARWHDTPPAHPVLLAGSTGSRGTTRLLMEAVSRLPQGGVILPGFDFDQPMSIWDTLQGETIAEDHPQARFADLIRSLDLEPDDVQPWTAAPAPSPARNRLISLSLRPAPVTDQWLTDGPGLKDLPEALNEVTLLEAPTPRLEAEAIALRLRQAALDGQTAALISPDRTLTRQVTAALDRWHILPDDSAGLPLQLSPVGRLLRQSAQMRCGPVDSLALFAALKHPLTHSTEDRNRHLLATRELELYTRRHGPAYPDAQSLRAWAAPNDRQQFADWAAWVGALLSPTPPDIAPLSTHLAQHRALAEALSGGPQGSQGRLWEGPAGEAAATLFEQVEHSAEIAADLSPQDYASLIGQILAGGEVRRPEVGHPNIRIWGTLEARVQSADLVILGGLTEGIWPEPPSPDPWLNRPMRKAAGLLLPDRRIGLAAHDYQQAVAAPEVWITRAIRSEEAETVPSRWVNRLTNLLGGLDGGAQLLTEMRARGQHWVTMAEALETPEHLVPSAPRPSPQVPKDARPKSISVTQVKTLIRDPYAIYARDILRLPKLDSLVPEPDAPLRGILIHEILRRFVAEGIDPAAPEAAERLIELADEQLATGCPWPAIQRHWRARFARVVPWFLQTEQLRRARAVTSALEQAGEIELTGLGLRLRARADRIDRAEDGRLTIYDYKTGAPPSEKEQEAFDKQLLLQAAMAERGAFDPPGAGPVADAAFIGLGSSPSQVAAPLDSTPAGQVWDDFVTLMQAWQDPARGYTARMAPKFTGDEGPYDHLSRYGEWDETQPPKPEDMS